MLHSKTNALIITALIFFTCKLGADELSFEPISPRYGLDERHVRAKDIEMLGDFNKTFIGRTAPIEFKWLEQDEYKVRPLFGFKTKVALRLRISVRYPGGLDERFDISIFQASDSSECEARRVRASHLFKDPLHTTGERSNYALNMAFACTGSTLYARIGSYPISPRSSR